MTTHLFVYNGNISRSALNICAVILILLLIDLSFARIASQAHIDEDEMLCVVMIHRHGDRTPVETYSTDPYKNYHWPGGYGALTQLGIRQLYDLGTNIRPRYKSLKPSDGIYTQETVHAISSCTERTRMSAASMLAAFWEPHEDANTLPIPWQPIPIEVIPAEDDNMLYHEKGMCPKYNQILHKLIIDPDPDTSIYEFNQRNKDLYKYLSEYIGKNVTNLMPAASLYDILIIQECHGLELPPWTNSIYPKMLYDARVRAFQLSTETDYMKRIRAGPLINRIYNQMAQFQSGKSARNIITYSAHDTTIANVLAAMNFIGQTDPIPSYGALLAFELYGKRNRNKEHTVQMVYYANSTVKTPKRLKIPACPSPCYFSDFEQAIAHLFVTDFAKDCKP